MVYVMVHATPVAVEDDIEGDDVLGKPPEDLLAKGGELLVVNVHGRVHATLPNRRVRGRTGVVGGIKASHKMRDLVVGKLKSHLF